MKKHANTLFVTTEGCYIAKQGNCLLVRKDRKTLLSLPVNTLEGVVCYGRIGMSPFALGLCGENNVSVAFLTKNGRLLARMSGPQNGNVLLRRSQFRFAESPEQSAAIARCFVSGKISNARTVLLRTLRDHPDPDRDERLERVVARLKCVLDSMWRQQASSMDIIRGMEGDAAKNYFSVFDDMILSEKDVFFFHQRSRRPPMDNVNSLLSFIYSLLTNDVRTACEVVGLDPQMGFLHADRSGRPSLALDLMEELRPFLADRLAISLINRRQVSAAGFETRENGSVIMSDKTRKSVIRAYQERKNETIKHPYLGETVTIGIIPLLQARLLARFFRGDLDMYPPFFWR